MDKNELPSGYTREKDGTFTYKFHQYEINEMKQNERVLLIIAILNWINVFLMGLLILHRLCSLRYYHTLNDKFLFFEQHQF